MEVKTKFATPSAIEGPTPKWATWSFRVVFLLTTAVSAWLLATNVFPEEVKYEISLAVKGIDFLAWGISRLFGVVIEKE